MTQGIPRVGELPLTITILTNEGQELTVKQALNVLKSTFQDGFAPFGPNFRMIRPRATGMRQNGRRECP